MVWNLVRHGRHDDRTGAEVAFEDPEQHPGWRLVLGYDHSPPPGAAALDPTEPFQVERTSVTILRQTGAAELTPSRVARLDFERAARQADQVAYELLSGVATQLPTLPVGFPFRGEGREEWYRHLSRAIEWYRELEQLSAMDAYRRIAERKRATVSTVKRWAHEARQLEGASS